MVSDQETQERRKAKIGWILWGLAATFVFIGLAVSASWTAAFIVTGLFFIVAALINLGHAYGWGG